MKETVYFSEDTITAISTPAGEGGIGIVRMSGPDALRILKQIFHPYRKKENNDGNFKTHKMYYGFIKGEEGELVDEVLVSFMASPATYTREDIVEINGHSGWIVLNQILELTVRHGARLAGPGEFTRRAYINGRIDLSQAESVLDIINARSEKAARIAARNVGGELSGHLEEIKEELLNLRMNLEVTFDFPEDDVGEVDYRGLQKDLERILKRIKNIDEGAKKGVLLQQGIRLSIVGKTNVGKSSLLNYLLKRNRAIVTEVPGTTRDTLEENVNIDGVPVRLIDTAGIRKTEDPVENMGVQRAREALEKADLIIIMLDGSTGIEKEDREIFKQLKERDDVEVVVLVNKIDIKCVVSREEVNEELVNSTVYHVSVVNEEGTKEVEEHLRRWVGKEIYINEENPVVVSKRHKESLGNAMEAMENTLKLAEERGPLDIISTEINRVEEKIGEITGEHVSEDLLDNIFENFCIGK